MNKITRLSNNFAAPVFDGGRANSVTQDRRFERCRQAWQAVPVRPTLIMVWRINPVSHRLECRWVVERDAATAEGASCGGFLRQAA
jgi:hypothetical protein